MAQRTGYKVLLSEPPMALKARGRGPLYTGSQGPATLRVLPTSRNATRGEKTTRWPFCHSCFLSPDSAEEKKILYVSSYQTVGQDPPVGGKP